MMKEKSIIVDQQKINNCTIHASTRSMEEDYHPCIIVPGTLMRHESNGELSYISKAASRSWENYGWGTVVTWTKLMGWSGRNCLKNTITVWNYSKEWC
jgi:hypothetical protein